MRGQVEKKKSRWPKILRPGWILFILFVIAFTYLSFTVLAPWQLNKDDDIVERNHQLEAAFEADPVPYQDVFNEDGSIDADKEWTRVNLTGQYLSDFETLLRMRPVASGPSYQSLIPFETTAGDVILINRGWIEAGDGNVVPDDLEPAPTGEVQLSGMVRQEEAVHPNPPIERDGYEQVYSINSETITEVTGVAGLGTAFVQLSDDQPGGLNPIPIPSMDRGNHLSYGYQWIAFGVLAPIGLGWFIFSEIRERRRSEEEQAELESLGTDSTSGKTSDSKNELEPEDPNATEETSNDVSDDASEDAPAAPAEPAKAASRRRRARYGDAHPDHYAKFNQRSQDRA
jgi:cytochrome oxidase assembly protein ShyY1